MRLLDRYLLRELLAPLFYCLSGFFVFWISFDLITEMDDFQHRHLTAADIGEYYLLKTPELLALVIPIALLLGLLYTLANHSRHQELTAMKAAGIGLWRWSLPYFGVGLLFSLILLSINEMWMPVSLEAAEELKNRRSPNQGSGSERSWKQNVHFRNARDGRIWNIGAYNQETFEMKNPQVEWTLPAGQKIHVMAQRGTRTNGGWTFFDVHQFSYSTSSDFDVVPLRTNILVIPEFSETPQDIKVQIKFNRLNSIDASKRPQLSLAELGYLKSHLQLNGRDQALLDTQFQARLAAPWTCLVVVFISLPFGAVTRRHSVFLGVASSILICFVFFILLRFGLALGTGGYLPGWMAAWLPNFLFGVLGFWGSLKAG